jgi:hypothetical protein
MRFTECFLALAGRSTFGEVRAERAAPPAMTKKSRTLCAQLQEAPELFNWDGDREWFVCCETIQEMSLVK